MKTIDEMSEELKKLEEQASNEEAWKKSKRQDNIRGGVEGLIMCMMVVVGIVGALLYRVRISNSAKESICAVVAIVVAIWGGYRIAMIERDDETAEESRLKTRREALMKEIEKAKEEKERKEIWKSLTR